LVLPGNFRGTERSRREAARIMAGIGAVVIGLSTSHIPGLLRTASDNSTPLQSAARRAHPLRGAPPGVPGTSSGRARYSEGLQAGMQGHVLLRQTSTANLPGPTPKPVSRGTDNRMLYS